MSSDGGGGGDGALGGLFSAPDAMAKIAADPKTRAFLSQPDFVAMLAEVQSTPSAANKYLSDPRMMAVLGGLLNVNIMGGKEFASAGCGGPEAPLLAPPPPPELSEEEKAAKESRAAALRAKEAGNECYKSKQLDAALAHYNSAIELDRTDISFLTNRAAVLFEQSKFAACFADCAGAGCAGPGAGAAASRRGRGRGAAATTRWREGWVAGGGGGDLSPGDRWGPRRTCLPRRPGGGAGRGGEVGGVRR